MTNRTRSLFSALAVILTSMGAASAQDAESTGCEVPPAYRESAFRKPMTFFETGNRGNSAQSNWIVGVGEIDGTTPVRFADFLSTVDNRRQRIVLHSPGGNLFAGMVLGLQIRNAGLSTQVGRTLQIDMESDFPCRTLENHIDSGECSSACAYAFLGGAARELSSDFHPTPQSKLGFHQFYGGLDLDQLRGLDADVAASQTVASTQIMVGYIASYLSQLEMNPGILHLSSSTTPDEMNYPDYQTLVDLGVITPSIFQSWFMEPFNDGLVAASREFSPITPTQQITAYCRSDTGEPVLMLTSDFSPNNVSAFLEPFARPKDVRVSEYPGMLEIDGVGHAIPNTDVNVASTGDLVFIRMAIPKSVARMVVGAGQFTLSYAAPNSEGFQSGSTELTEVDRKSIALAFRNCV